MKKHWLAFVCAAAFLLSCVVIPDAIYAAAPRVGCATATRRDIKSTVQLSGKLAAEPRAICAPVGVYIKKLTVGEGDYVKAGECVAEIDLKSSKKALIAAGDYAAAAVLEQSVCAEQEGYISEVCTYEGAYVESGGQIALIIAADNLYVAAAAGEQSVSRISKGMDVMITGSGFEGREYSGLVECVGATASSSNGVNGFELAVSINSPDRYLKAGYTVKLSIVTGVAKSVLCVPSGAILQQDTREYVYVLQGSSASRRYITTGRSDREYTEVLEGLQPNEIVALDAQGIAAQSVNVVVDRSAQYAD